MIYYHHMRTTLTIDDDLMRKIREKADKLGISQKDAVNRALRNGIENIDKTSRRKNYQCKTFHLGYPLKTNLDRALDLAEYLETEEVIRKLALRK